MARRLTVTALPCATLVALALLSCLWSCPRHEEAPAPSYRVHLVTSGSVPESWELAAGRGLDRIRDELGASVSRVQGDDENARRADLRARGQEGVDLVFCLGGGFEPMVFSEATGFPDTRFVVLPGSAHTTNVAGVEFHLEGAAYLGGVLAGLLSDRSVAGVLHGVGGPWFEGIEDSFLAGFRSLRKGGALIEADGSTGPWHLVSQGAVVAMYVADSADAAALAAASNAGLHLVATDPASVATDPEVVLAAVVVDLPEAMVRVAREEREGTFQGGIYGFDLGSGVVNLQLGPQVQESPNRSLHEALEAARAEVIAGIVELERLGI